MFYACEHCGALRNEKNERFRFAKGEDHMSFCCYEGQVLVDEETPTPIAQEILHLW